MKLKRYAITIMLNCLVFLCHGDELHCDYADSFLFEEICYGINLTGYSWFEEKDNLKNGIVMAKINSTQHMNAIYNYSAVDREYWIGANDIDQEGTFIWYHDNSTATTDLQSSVLWLPGEPANSEDIDCVVIKVSNGLIGLMMKNCSSSIYALTMYTPTIITVSTDSSSTNKVASTTATTKKAATTLSSINSGSVSTSTSSTSTVTTSGDVLTATSINTTTSAHQSTTRCFGVKTVLFNAKLYYLPVVLVLVFERF